MDVQEVKTKMQQAMDTEFARDRYDRVRCPSIAIMAEYIKTVFPDLDVRVEGSEDTKDTKAGRLRIPGKTYYGNRIIIRNRDGKKIFDHDSTQTYRRNTEIARWILDREKDLDQIKMLQEAGWKEDSRFNYQNWSLDGETWYRLDEAVEIVSR